MEMKKLHDDVIFENEDIQEYLSKKDEDVNISTIKYERKK